MVIADRRLAPSEQPDYKGFNSIANNVDVPSLVQVQINSFNWLKTDGLKDLLEEISPIGDFSGGRFDLRFLSHEIRKPKNTERECRKREITFGSWNATARSSLPSSSVAFRFTNGLVPPKKTSNSTKRPSAPVVAT